MVGGKGIAASGVGGVPEVVTSEREALLVPPDDPQSLATALGRLLEDRALRHRLGQAARQRAERAFTVDTMAAAYVALYARAVQSRGAAGRPRVPGGGGAGGGRACNAPGRRRVPDHSP